MPPITTDQRPGLVIYTLSADAYLFSAEDLRAACPVPAGRLVVIALAPGCAPSESLLAFLRELLAAIPDRLAVCRAPEGLAVELLEVYFPTLEDCFAEIGPRAATALGHPPLEDKRESSEPKNQPDRLFFTVTAPKSMAPRHSYIVDVWAHTADQRGGILNQVAREFGTSEPTVRTKAGGKGIERGTALRVTLSMPEFTVRESSDELVWEGEPSSASFAVTVPADLRPGQYVGRAGVFLGTLPLGRVLFPVVVDRNHCPVPAPAGDPVPLARRAFASYASDDRAEVLKRVQGIEKVGIDVFVDVARLRSGEDWQNRLFKEITSRQLFYLFWSRAAKQSPWVDWEWRLALRTWGQDAIDPVPLESPDLAPPPPELSGRHFNDWVLLVLHR